MTEYTCVRERERVHDSVCVCVCVCVSFVRQLCLYVSLLPVCGGVGAGGGIHDTL